MPISHSALAVLCYLVVFSGCNKKKELPAVVEEAPAMNEDLTTSPETPVALPEEPDLQAVGDKSASSGQFGSPSEAAGFSDRGSFVVQVSVFKSRNQAAGFVTKLADMGYPAYVAEVENPTADLAGTYHRVRIGNFLRIADAREFGENTLSSLGYDFWVDNKSNDQIGAASDYSSPSESYSTPSTDYSPEPSPTPESPANVAPSSNSWDTPEANSLDTPSTGSDTPVDAATPEPAPVDTDPWGVPSEPSPPPPASETDGSEPAGSGSSTDEW